METETSDQSRARKLEVGTVVNVEGSVYELRFPATFYPSKDNESAGWMVDQWGNRKYVTLAESGVDTPLGSSLVN